MHDRLARAWATYESFTSGSYGDAYREYYTRHHRLIPRNERTQERWTDVPIIGREELTRLLPSMPPLEYSMGFNYTSGTSGRGILMTPVGAHFNQCEDLQDPNTTTLHISARHYLVATKTRYAGDPAYPLFNAWITEKYNITHLRGSIASLVSLATHLSSETLQRIRYITLAADRTTLLHFRYIRKLFPNARIFSTYASAEIDAGAYSSNNDFPLIFTPFAYTLAEVVQNGEGDASVGEEGRLLMSVFPGQGVPPLLRYDTEDIVKVEQRDESTSMVAFSFQGRKNSAVIKIFGGSISTGSLEDALSNLADARIFDYSAEVTEVPGKEQPVTALHVTLLTRVDLSSTDIILIRERLSKLLTIGVDRTYEAGVSRGWYAPLEVSRAPVIASQKNVRLSDKR